MENDMKRSDVTIVNFGDSIFGYDNVGGGPLISDYISGLTGATVYNAGFGGCRMSSHHHDNWTPFSMFSLANAVTSGDFSIQERALRGELRKDGDPSLPTYFPERIEALRAVKWSEVDIATISFGTNDFTANNRRIYNDGDRYDTDTYAGALRYSIEKLRSAFPHIKLYIISPTYRFFIDRENGFRYIDDSDTHVNKRDNTLLDFVKATADIAAEYGLPYIDNYYGPGISRENRYDYFYETDGTHHKAEGKLLIAEHIVKCIFGA